MNKQFKLNKKEIEYVTPYLRSKKIGSRQKKRAKVIHSLHLGQNDDAIVKALGIAPTSIQKWKECFLQNGVSFIEEGNKPGGGRKRTIKASDVKKIIQLGERALKGDYSITCSSVAEIYETSKSTINRIWNENDIKLPNHGRWKESVLKKSFPKIKPKL